MNIIGSSMEIAALRTGFQQQAQQRGQYEATALLNVFNRMMEQLKNERLMSARAKTIF